MNVATLAPVNSAVKPRSPEKEAARIERERMQAWLIIMGKRREWLAKKVEADDRLAAEAKELAYQFLTARYLRHRLLDT